MPYGKETLCLVLTTLARQASAPELSRWIGLTPALVRRFGRGHRPHENLDGMGAGQGFNRAHPLLLGRDRATDGHGARYHLDPEITRVYVNGCQPLKQLFANGFVATIHACLRVALNERPVRPNVASDYDRPSLPHIGACRWRHLSPPSATWRAIISKSR